MPRTDPRIPPVSHVRETPHLDGDRGLTLAAQFGNVLYVGPKLFAQLREARGDQAKVRAILSPVTIMVFPAIPDGPRLISTAPVGYN